MTDKYVWLLGGSILQYPMAMEIKRRGYKLLLADMNPECVCRPLADLFYPASIYDEVTICNLAKSLAVKVEAVLTAGADAGVEVSAAAEVLGLPAAPLVISKIARSKARMRILLEQAAPKFTLALRGDKVDWSIYPCVVKPADASGSNGISVIGNPDNLPMAIDTARKFARQDNRVLIEEWLPGQNVLTDGRFDSSEIALDYFIDDGIAHYANGALRLFWLDYPGIEAGHLNPFIPDGELSNQVQRIVSKLGLQWGPFKIDFKKVPGRGWVLMEMATRLSGGFDHAFTCPLATGKDITGAMLDIALGLPLDFGKLAKKTRKNNVNIACCFAPLFDPGKVKRWQVPKSGSTYILAKNEIFPLTSNSKRAAFVITTGQGYGDALNNALELTNELRPEYV